jgi:hypothetical protein
MQVVQDGGMHTERVRGWLWAACAVPGLCLATACSGPPATTTSAAVPAANRPASVAPTRTATAGPASTNASLAPTAQVTVTHVRTADGSLVTVAIFRGPVHYVLHNGSVDPGSLAAGLVRAGPVVAGAERRHLLAAFTGGFMLNNRVGGYEQEGHVISPLQRGVASLVIDRSGLATLGVWGYGVPAPGEAVYSVLQNLPPLVYRGRPVPTAGDWRLWGPTLGGGEYVARTSLGEDSSGELMVAASMSTNPADLADALIRNGARFAMELDINPEWVQLDTATRPGGPLAAAVPGQIRPADQYLVGWTRDFVAVVAP